MRWIVGILLITAAASKGWELLFYPTALLTNQIFETSWSRSVLPILVGGELGLGLAALLGLFWRQLRWLTLLLFSGFAAYSLLLVWQGAESCGCFGLIAISPWWTLSLDILIILGIGVESVTNRRQEAFATRPSRLSPRVQLAGTLLSSLTVAVVLAWHVTPKPTEQGFHSVGDLIVLEPETWIGKDFPLLSEIDLDVSRGRWVLLLHRHDCPKCQEAVPRYDKLAELASQYQVAIIQVPPHDTENETPTSFSHVGRLRDLHDWFVETPVEIELNNGVVLAASTDLPALSKSRLADEKLDKVSIQTLDLSDPQSEHHGAFKL